MDYIKKLNIFKLSNILFWCLTVIVAVSYIHISNNPVVIDGVETFPYKIRTGIYLAILVVIDIINMCSNLFAKRWSDFDNLIHDKVSLLMDSLCHGMKKVILNNWFKIVIATLIFLVASIILYKNTIISYNDTEYTERTIPYISVCGITDEIIDGRVLEQTFTTDLDEIYGVYLRTATYARQNDSYLDISILTMDDAILAEEYFSVANAVDNGFTYFSFQSPINIQGIDQLKCRIISKDNSGGNGITVYRSSIDQYQEGNLTIDGTDTGYDCFLQLRGKQFDSKLISNIYIKLCVYIFVFVVVIGILLSKNERLISPEKVFLVIASVIGILFILIMPPYAEHDGEAHFNTIYKYSNLILGHEVSRDAHAVEKEMKDIFGQQFFYPANKGDYYTIQKMLFEKDNRREMYGVNELGLGIVDFPIAYAFSVLGVVTGRLIGLNILCIYYLARLFNFCGFVILTFYAIKLIPIYKKTLLMIAILPMTLMQAASVSYDATIMGTSFLFISLCIYLIENEMKKRHLVLLILLSFSLLCFKESVYFPIIGLILLVPFRKRLDTKQRLLFWSILIAFVSVAAIAYHVDAGQTVQTTSQSVTQVGDTYPLTYSLKHPYGFTKMFCNTIYGTFEMYFKGLFGVSIFGFSAINTPLIQCVPVVSFLILMNRYESDGSTQYIENRKKIWILLCGIVSVLMIFLGAMTWSKIGDNYIQGVQGRYFIPILPLFMFFRNGTVKETNKRSNDILYYMYILDGYYVLYVFSTIAANTIG